MQTTAISHSRLPALPRSVTLPRVVHLAREVRASMSSSLPQLPDSSCGTGSGSVPVFNCVIILRRDPESDRLQGRVANLAGIRAEGFGERDVLIAITKRFKSAMIEYQKSNQPIPWVDPPEPPEIGEQQRFVPVHL